ncbi:MAG: hypothetical protein ABSA79_07740 [Candidatus Bathyarchaeia archaeon]
MSEKELRRLIRAAEGKCQPFPPYLKCHHGKFPFCTDGKSPEVVKAHIWCHK